MKPSYKFYRFCFRLAHAFIGIVYHLRVIGKENVPEGAAIVGANHSNTSDPFLAAFAFGIENQMHILAKKELFRIPVISQILRKLGMVRVDRGITDMDSVKTTLNYLRNGEKIVIFPEGTRASKDNAVAAKDGAVKMAEHAAVPLVPFYIPRKKRFFSKVTVVIGEPYFIEKPDKKRTPEDYARLSDELMDKIKSLNPLQ